MTTRRPSKLDSLERVYVADRAAWRAWLAEHHAGTPGIWLVFDRKTHREDRLAYEDAVEEALCFGWIDSTTRRLDEQRYMQLFTPRKPSSVWSRTNKARVARLVRQKLMAPAGLAAVAVAKRNGAWTSLDAAESLEVPPDLAAALDAIPGARGHFDTFPASARKAYLHHVTTAKRAETRERRVREVAELAARNQKVPQPRREG